MTSDDRLALPRFLFFCDWNTPIELWLQPTLDDTTVIKDPELPKVTPQPQEDNDS